MYAALLPVLFFAAAPSSTATPWTPSLVLVGTVDDDGDFVATSNGVLVGAGGEVLTVVSAVATEAPVWAVDARGVRHAATVRDDDDADGLARLSVPTLAGAARAAARQSQAR